LRQSQPSSACAHQYQPARDLAVDRAHLGVAEVSARDAGLIRHDDRRVAVRVQQAQRVDDRRQDHDAAGIAEKALVLDDGAVAIEEHGRTLHAKSSSCSTKSQMM
jgi:hypothetical protein